MTKVGNYLILQLKRFVIHNGGFIQEITKIHCTRALSVPLAADHKIHGVPYLYIYEAIFKKYCFGAWMSFLVFRQTSLHITSAILQFVKNICTVRELGCLSLSLDATILHITSVSLLYMVRMLLDWWSLASTAWHTHS